MGECILNALTAPTMQGVHHPPPPEQRFGGVGDAAADTVRVPWLADGAPFHFCGTSAGLRTLGFACEKQWSEVQTFNINECWVSIGPPPN